MGGKQMEGDNRERRKKAKEARDHGRMPSEDRATLGASKQREEAAGNDDHGTRLDLKQGGKTPGGRRAGPNISPGSRGNRS
jgi:hypothetical protein